MAQIWMDDENAGANLLPRSARKALGGSAGKKSVLNKLDNMIGNNKSHITPFKGANISKWPSSCAPKLSLCKETLQKQHRKQLLQQNREASLLLEGQLKAPQFNAVSDLYAKSADPSDSLDLFDSMDFPSEKCLKNCQKRTSKNWMEPLLSAELIDQLLNSTLETDEERAYEIPIYRDLDNEDFALRSLEPKITESVDNSTAMFEPMLPPIIYDTDFEEELF